ncbi:hypothetical protein SAMN04488503_2912 [Humidesulfovibrio mexicanus]|uniref:Uncharacterized protein n=1 Tax=Humidesulfovibrio mexicanus TaxID=147047 RepID=A0A239C2G4_9BACT|nr:hypothetical protein [Humidesulfovibrio mexicanus]SNS14356.1 hypothetical protein SAMN04488503_2912 [Humidesulfovibrio mexicanus]
MKQQRSAARLAKGDSAKDAPAGTLSAGDCACAEAEALRGGLGPEPTEEDERAFAAITATALTDEERERIARPAVVLPRQERVLAVHWHPEFVPMELIRRRIEATFPGCAQGLFIPTQHNQILSYDAYCGVEVDCYSSGFNQKVQLLVHFRADRQDKAGVLASMLAHTARYRSSQLFEFLDVLAGRDEERLNRVAAETGAAEETIRFARIHARKLSALLERHAGDVPLETLKNKLVRGFLDAQRPRFGDRLVTRVQSFAQAVKLRVKAQFPMQYFYRASEVIEEARGFGAGVVIPHPEQFWPILLADYDVDGYEVWNPQSQRYTEFLIDTLARKNRKGWTDRRQLVFMGDDTHMSEKIRNPDQASDKVLREIGVQSAWDDIGIRKRLLASGMDRACVINEYTARLDG